MKEDKRTFVAPVVYVQPSFEELKHRFHDYVNPRYRGRRFEPIERCKSTSNKTRDIAFEYINLDRSMLTHEVLAEMDRRGLRPALYEELLGFVEKYPDEYRKYPVAALGSETLMDGDRCVPYLWDDMTAKSLYLGPAISNWWGTFRFLAVRE